MVDSDVIARRVLALNEALLQLQRTEARDAERLRTDPLLRAAVERWLQVAIEACIDSAFHIVAERGWTPPDSARGAFSVLAGHGLIDGALASRLGGAASMRNVLVHDYVDVDLDRVAHAVEHDLDDLRSFGAAVAALIDTKR